MRRPEWRYPFVIEVVELSNVVRRLNVIHAQTIESRYDIHLVAVPLLPIIAERVRTYREEIRRDSPHIVDARCGECSLETFIFELAKKCRDGVDSRLAACDPHPIGSGAFQFYSSHNNFGIRYSLGNSVICIATIAPYGATCQSNENHRFTDEVAFALNRPINCVRRKWEFHVRLHTPFYREN